MSFRPRRGFTLIELLVVIAIIAILAAILFPVFARAREQARKTSCLSNEKQLGLGFLMYAQDYDEFLPGIRFGGNPGESWPWVVWGGPGWTGVFNNAVQPYIKNKQILQCGSDSANDRWEGANGMSYGYNEFLYNYNNGWCGLGRLSNAPGGVAKVSMIVETFASGIYNDWDSGGPYTVDDGMDRIRYGGWDPWLSHHEGTNIMYADGHTKFLGMGAIMSTRLSGPCVQRPIVYPGCNEP